MLTTVILGAIGVALVITGITMYKKDNAKNVISAIEVFLIRNGKIAMSEIFKFKNKEELDKFIKEETEHAKQNEHIDEEQNLNSIAKIYAIEAPVEILKEIKKNCISHDDINKYINKPAENVYIHNIK